MGSVAELCRGAALHAGELLAAECCCLSLVKKDCDGKNTLEEVVDLCSRAHPGLVKGVMGRVLAAGSPVNLRGASEVSLGAHSLVVVALPFGVSNKITQMDN